MNQDNLCKSLIESNPRPFITWLLGEAVGDTLINILKTELSVEPIRADFVSFLQVGEQILHLEFQTQADPEMPLRMLDYYTRLYRQYRLPIRQVVLFLRPTTSANAQMDYFQTENTVHRYRVIRLWEVKATDLLPFPTLWPLAILANSPNPDGLLTEVVRRLETLEDRELRLSLTAYTYLLGGLRFKKEMLKQLLREEIMRESVTYRELVETSEQRGIQRGRQEGEVLLTLRQLNHKFGPLSEDMSQQIRSLSLPQLENLAEALLDFQTPTDLMAWLQQIYP
ncbi:Rpn family recombination-promoting nuclease/putative transposase [Thermosynechococcaceae cyanobacterium BACA0444]|uniref:Rpn family recombination-promoting nuclease/putative transposase n=1 Tax=Pseudocalidococcus azoricus BACA0444 TaxID=2918990 RepID=A0AAE4FRL1_9CYAN|nr:Rpn family recombination-promoting nuclease/putative transposase [Pseudocalidococcus azoricus]MDS3861018.1 Rpn family recombination-promoting nuclease/putative transposase [Pseudocalidococcus azoricus BACA0444]